jgi:hypothetical protein
VPILRTGRIVLTGNESVPRETNSEGVLPAATRMQEAEISPAPVSMKPIH